MNCPILTICGIVPCVSSDELISGILLYTILYHFRYEMRGQWDHPVIYWQMWTTLIDRLLGLVFYCSLSSILLLICLRLLLLNIKWSQCLCSLWYYISMFMCISICWLFVVWWYCAWWIGTEPIRFEEDEASIWANKADGDHNWCANVIVWVI